MNNSQGQGAHSRGWKLMGFLPILAFFVMACNLSSQSPTATATQSVTQAYQTVQAQLTAAVALTPQTTPSPLPTESGLATLTASPSPSPTAALQITPTTTAFCDLAAAGNPIDITIPDDTLFKPGEVFTKIWGVSNAGSCTWTIEYAAVWFSGEMMGAPSTVALTDNVLPGETVEISVDMLAPLSPGTFQSNWKLRNAEGLLFGIGPNGDSPFWVRIEVVSAPTETAAPSPEPSITETPTPTQAVLANSTVSLDPGDTLDLDSAQLNPGTGADINYQADGQGMLFISPLPGVSVGFWGPTAPGLVNCQTTNLSTSPLPVDSLAPGGHLCYQTDQGHFGWIRLVDHTPDDALVLEILTWAP